MLAILRNPHLNSGDKWGLMRINERIRGFKALLATPKKIDKVKFANNLLRVVFFVFLGPATIQKWKLVDVEFLSLFTNLVTDERILNSIQELGSRPSTY